MLASSTILTIFSSYFGSALQAVDDALSSAAGVKKKTSEEVDEAFERAIEVLSDYEAEFHPSKSMSGDSSEMTVYDRMAEAKTKDKTSSSRILNVLKAKSSRKVRLAHRTPSPPKIVLILTTRHPKKYSQNQQR
jgi:hypothetical protein